LVQNRFGQGKWSIQKAAILIFHKEVLINAEFSCKLPTTQAVLVVVLQGCSCLSDIVFHLQKTQLAAAASAPQVPQHAPIQLTDPLGKSNFPIPVFIIFVFVCLAWQDISPS